MDGVALREGVTPCCHCTLSATSVIAANRQGFIIDIFVWLHKCLKNMDGASRVTQRRNSGMRARKGWPVDTIPFAFLLFESISMSDYLTIFYHREAGGKPRVVFDFDGVFSNDHNIKRLYAVFIAGIIENSIR